MFTICQPKRIIGPQQQKLGARERGGIVIMLSASAHFCSRPSSTSHAAAAAAAASTSTSTPPRRSINYTATKTAALRPALFRLPPLTASSAIPLAASVSILLWTSPVNAGILSGFSGLESVPGPQLPQIDFLKQWNDENQKKYAENDARFKSSSVLKELLEKSRLNKESVGMVAGTKEKLKISIACEVQNGVLEIALPKE
ncbi:uncharacterized protein LOC122041119 isoform X2 [Zingiber officinale]|uniref:uncharacterized protein LOC122041119 isoform X2 n=1 Tax=Zingiber officinale TaxID=94328 RepID=UPI001C4D96F1|nr:uncharacterized protein LOC122041119 isoform X2 [Zingiber officinale]